MKMTPTFYQSSSSSRPSNLAPNAFGQDKLTGHAKNDAASKNKWGGGKSFKAQPWQPSRLGNKKLTGNRWLKTGLTCHSINQHKQCKQTEIRRWQSLHGSTSAFVHGDFGQHEVQRKLFCQTTCQHDDSAFKPFCSPAKICRWKNKRCTGWRHKNGCWFSSEVHWLAPQN